MKMFRGLSNWIGMDMGSSQVRIYRENKVILAEASTVAVDNIDGHVLGLARRRSFITTRRRRIFLWSGRYRMASSLIMI